MWPPWPRPARGGASLSFLLGCGRSRATLAQNRPDREWLLGSELDDRAGARGPGLDEPVAAALLVVDEELCPSPDLDGRPASRHEIVAVRRIGGERERHGRIAGELRRDDALVVAVFV